MESFVSERGGGCVTLADVQALRKKHLSKGGMADEIKGYDVSTCFSQGNCPNSVVDSGPLIKDIQALMKEAKILSFLKSEVHGDLKFHHEFRVCLSDCPNGCSQPQIADIGIIGAGVPGITTKPCSSCEACVFVCPEQAVILKDTGPEVDNTCLYCAKCVAACPSGTIEVVKAGYRVLLGGRLGRHPRLGMEVPGILSPDEVLDFVRRCLTFYKTHSKDGKRFSHVLESLSQII